MRHITKGPEPAELCAYGGAQGTTYDIGSCSSPARLDGECGVAGAALLQSAKGSVRSALQSCRLTVGTRL